MDYREVDERSILSMGIYIAGAEMARGEEMPVIEHETHESTKIGSEWRYGCHNKPRPEENEMVISEYASKFSPFHFGISWPYKFSTECRFDMSLSDPACTGCQWRGSGEDYDKMIRSNGK